MNRKGFIQVLMFILLRKIAIYPVTPGRMHVSVGQGCVPDLIPIAHALRNSIQDLFLD